MKCGTCRGRGELRNTDGTVFRCPECSANKHPSTTERAPPTTDEATDRAKGKEPQLPVRGRTWALVLDAAEKDGMAPKTWAEEALAKAARDRIAAEPRKRHRRVRSRR